jgi:CheY-like chemotaxis protein
MSSRTLRRWRHRSIVTDMPPLVQPAKLLLVDDLPSNLLVLEAVLGGPDYVLIKATSGPEALSLLKQNPDVALILLDVQMPDMNGFDVSRRIKQMPEFANIPIIFITAIHKEDPFVKEGYKAGAIDYFSKPFDPEILKMKVSIYAAFRQRSNLLNEKERQIKETEKLLNVSRKLSAALEMLPVGVIVADMEGRVCQTNAEVLRILKSVEQIKNDSYGEFISWWESGGQLLKAKDGPLMRALSEGYASHNKIITIKCLDGTAKSVFISGSPLTDLEKRIIGAVLVIQDASAHIEIESEIEESIVQMLSPQEPSA